jgi:hypothetical protein
MVNVRYGILFLVFLSMLVGPSCLKEMPESEEDLPQTLTWNPALAFPLGKDSFGMNARSGFDTTLFEYDTLTGLPQWVSELSFAMEGRVPFDLNSYSDNVEDIQSLMFRVNMYNGFPHEMLVQGYFLSIDMDTLALLFQDGTVRVNPGGVKQGGALIDPANLRKDALFDKEDISNLEEAVEILLRGIIQNPEVDTNHIPFYPEYHFDVDVGFMVDLSINL